jgi:hypothetical protein
MQTTRKNSIRTTSLLGLLILALLGLNLAPTRAAGPLCYVDGSAAGANSGTSWADAYTDLQSALADTGCSEVWVASGTYYPTSGTSRTATFQLKNGVALYGGFSGAETVRDQRNPDPATNNTVLSGDIGTPGVTGDNSYHIVTGSGTDNTAGLDGFTVTAGNASPSQGGGGMYNNPGSPTLTNVTFSSNRASLNGGGMYNNSGSSPGLTNVTFSGNVAVNSLGGGMYNQNNSPALTNVTFSGNSAYFGGGMYNNTSSPTLTNVTFSGNSAKYYGGGMNNLTSSPTLVNVIITNSSGGDCVNSMASLNAASANNLIEEAANACGLTDGVDSNIIGADPNLGPLADNGGSTETHALLPSSPAIDAGDDVSCPTTDQRGVTRPQGPHCDIGAFEVEPLAESDNTIYLPILLKN